MTINAGDLAIWRSRPRKTDRHVVVLVIGHAVKSVKVLECASTAFRPCAICALKISKAWGGC